MSMKCGIVGLPNVGKSTLFNTLSSAKAQSANFPFCTIEPNVGIITVPDQRLFDLEKLVQPEKVIPTNIEIVDIAGLVKGASKGEGLGNQFLGNIKNTHAILHVVRCFDDDNIVHVDEYVDPVRDKEIIDFELQLKDLESIENQISKTEKIAKSGDKEAKKKLEILAHIQAEIESGKSARNAIEEKSQWEAVKDLNLLTLKPVLYVCNVDEQSVVSGNKYTERLMEAVADEQAEVLFVSASIESELMDMEREDQQLFLEEMGLQESGVGRLIAASYKLLNYITYFTAGKKEVRAWTIEKGWAAPKAAGVIHSDFEKGFIRAEVISFDDFVQYKSESAVKDAGKMRVEGKEYIVQDGDVMHFRFNN
ncbi:MAG: redox-regulated ATPase YchF [Bacteroidetes bacterium MED-G17]|nr:MAG: redox-regulated ATPase YchF [Bacteroidetes bacterium MED-G17]|tara:strand:- start:11243 stop:12337 length:1095 start_codon:yes stop_codon:yes gene_type:complete